MYSLRKLLNDLAPMVMDDERVTRTHIEVPGEVARRAACNEAAQ